MNKLNNIEKNVLEVALDNMEEHLEDLSAWGGGDDVEHVVIMRRLDTLKTLRKKLL